MERALMHLLLVAALLPVLPLASTRAQAAGLNAAADGWASETHYEHAKHELRALCAAVADSMGAAKSLLPARPSFLHSAAAWEWPPSARQTPATAGPLFGTDAVPDGIAAAVAALMAPLQGLSGLRFEVKVHAVRDHGDNNYSVSARMQAAAFAGTAGLQRNADWEASFAIDGKSGVRLAVLRSSAVQWSSFAAPLLRDITPEVFGTDPLFATCVARGPEFWFGRLQALGELSFFGHNGLAVGDVNNDGLDDLYLCMPNGIPNRLYLQQADGSATECAAAWGVDWLDDTKAALFADFDNDSDQDLALAMGPTIMIQRQHDGKFIPSNGLRSSTQASFYSLSAADFDNDGDLDVFGVRYVKTRYGENVPQPLHDAHNGPTNHLLRNDGVDGWADVTNATGLGVTNDRFSLAAAWLDYDNDGDSDLCVANDFGLKNLYRNDAGHFTDVATAAGCADAGAGMGVAVGDPDNDGDLDLYFSNMFSAAGRRIAFQPQFHAQQADRAGVQQLQRLAFGNSLLLNNGAGGFADNSSASGTFFGRWAWGALFADLNNDGSEDLYVPNGFVTAPLEDDL